MKSFRSSKSKKQKQPSNLTLLSIALATVAITALGSYLQLGSIDQQRPGPLAGTKIKKVALQGDTKHVLSSSTSRGKSRASAPRPSPPPTLSIPPPPTQPLSFGHLSIVTTFFWVGESSSGDNGGIANNSSTWDEQWQEHYGDVDDPLKRSGYLPSGFTPKENPFYIALPYSDLADDSRRPSATSCPLYALLKTQPYSWCKNSWIAVRHAGKIVYAQWEDAGPFGENDTSYVFGSSKPASKVGDKAGLDVSPAVRDYLGLQDVDNCDWAFVSAENVPGGPWKQIITTTPSYSVGN
jgi:hypothetical protein